MRNNAWLSHFINVLTIIGIMSLPIAPGHTARRSVAGGSDFDRQSLGQNRPGFAPMSLPAMPSHILQFAPIKKIAVSACLYWKCDVS